VLADHGEAIEVVGTRVAEDERAQPREVDRVPGGGGRADAEPGGGRRVLEAGERAQLGDGGGELVGGDGVERVERDVVGEGGAGQGVHRLEHEAELAGHAGGAGADRGAIAQVEPGCDDVEVFEGDGGAVAGRDVVVLGDQGVEPGAIDEVARAGEHRGVRIAR
jgi:hypothetical protein